MSTNKKKMSRWNLPFKMLWKKIKANIHMPCSVQSPPSYAFSSSSDRCLPGFLFCALGVRLNICHCLAANRSKSLLLISPSYFFVTLWFLFFSWALSLRLEHKCASVIVLWRAVLRLSSSAPRLAASPCYSKGCWRGEAQVCDAESEPGTSGSWNKKNECKRKKQTKKRLNYFFQKAPIS